MTTENQAPEGAPDLRTAFESWALHTPPDERTNWEVFQAGARAALAAKPATVNPDLTVAAAAEGDEVVTEPMIAAFVRSVMPGEPWPHPDPVQTEETRVNLRAAIGAALAAQPQPKGTATGLTDDEREELAFSHTNIEKGALERYWYRKGLKDMREPTASQAPAPAQSAVAWLQENPWGGDPLLWLGHALTPKSRDAAEAHGVKFRPLVYGDVASPAVVDGWQPIETAPKDGSLIILGYADFAEEGYWMGDPSRNHWRETGWFGSSEDVLTTHPSKPSHWQPLPPPVRSKPPVQPMGGA